MDRDVLSGEARRQSDLLHLRPGHAAGLSGAGWPVRELVHADRGDPRGSALAVGAGRRPHGARHREQSLHPDRPGAVDRALRQERDPDRGGRARAAAVRGQADPRGRNRGSTCPLPPDPDDLVRLHPRRGAAGAGDRRRRQRPQVDRHRGVQRHAGLDLPGGAVRAVVLRGGAPLRGMAGGAQGQARDRRPGRINAPNRKGRRECTRRPPLASSIHHFTANTQTVPPCGTSGYLPGNSRFMRLCILAGSTPQPDCTAMYCLPSTWNETGTAATPEPVGNSHRILPVLPSKARNMRSLVPPANSSPPPVASTGPQLNEGRLVAHTFLPLSTSQACSSPTWSAPATIFITFLATPM